MDQAKSGIAINALMLSAILLTFNPYIKNVHNEYQEGFITSADCDHDRRNICYLQEETSRCLFRATGNCCIYFSCGEYCRSAGPGTQLSIARNDHFHITWRRCY